MTLALYYNSRTGTFCSADPLAGDPSDPQSWNRYPYGRNDPINITDPSGQSWWSDALAALAAPFTGGASLFLGFLYDNVQDVVHDRNPTFFGFSAGGGMSLGSSWNGTPIMPYRGLTKGVQGALGLPTMDDAVGGVINNATDTVSAYQPGRVTCFFKGVWAGAADYTNLSLIGAGNVDNFRVREFDWHNPLAFGIDYRPDPTVPEGSALFRLLGYGNDAVEHGTDLVDKLKPLRKSMWRETKAVGMRTSWGEFTHSVRVVGKNAGRVSTALAVKAGLDRYSQCRGD